MLWRKVRSKLVLDTPKINDKNPKIDLEILFGLTHDSTKQYSQILQKYFFDWSIDIFQSLIDHIEFSTETQWRLVTAVCRICLKYTKGIMVRLHPHRVTNWHYVTVKKKENVSWAVKCQTMDVVYDCRVTSAEPHWRITDSMIVLFVKPSHKKNYLPDNCVSMKLRVVNN